MNYSILIYLSLLLPLTTLAEKPLMSLLPADDAPVQVSPEAVLTLAPEAKESDKKTEQKKELAIRPVEPKKDEAPRPKTKKTNTKRTELKKTPDIEPQGQNTQRAELLDDATPPMETKEINTKGAELGPIYLGEYLQPWEHSESQDMVEFLFDNAELSTLLQYVEERFNVIFILDDAIQPLPTGGKSIVGTKISFKTHKPLSRKDAWNLFVTFLDMAGLAPAPGPGKNVYKLMPSQDPKAARNVTHSPLPTFIGVDPSLIPNNDVRIRYIYFVENASLDVVTNVINMMKSVSSPDLRSLPELNAVIITDKAANIKDMLALIKELDQANMPESLAVIKLKRTDATKAAALYASLTAKSTDQSFGAQLFRTRRQSTAEYFSEYTRVIPEPRTNSLIVLGSRESIKKITDFIVTIIDQKDSLPEVPLYVYRCKFVDASSMEKILTQATKFQATSAAGKVGGVRDEDKYFKQVTITAEQSTNTLVINAEYDDYSKIFDLLQKLDVEQPQVALKVFILSIDLTDEKDFGIQLRNKIPGVAGLIGNDTNFQTSGLAGTVAGSGVIENTSSTSSGATRLLGDLVSLASGIKQGSTIVSLGSDAFGVWGILNMLQTYTRLTVVANPFLVTTHKYPALFSIGESRRVQNTTAFGTSSIDATGFISLDADLSVSITPQIGRDGLITLDVKINIDQFTDSNPLSTDGNRTTKRIETSVIVADNEVLALGGLIKETTRMTTTGIPILSSIPLLGWLFKNKNKQIVRSSLLILIMPEVIEPTNIANAESFTRSKILDAKDTLSELKNPSYNRDPVHRWMFHDNENNDSQFVDNFTSTKGRYTQDANIGAKSTKSLSQHEKEEFAKKTLQRSIIDSLPE